MQLSKHTRLEMQRPWFILSALTNFFQLHNFQFTLEKPSFLAIQHKFIGNVIQYNSIQIYFSSIAMIAL